MFSLESAEDYLGTGCVPHEKEMPMKLQNGAYNFFMRCASHFFRMRKTNLSCRILLQMHCGWQDAGTFKLMRNNADYKAYMTYLSYAPEIQSMIYTTNWIERLNWDFRRVTGMRTAMLNEESVLTLMGSVAMEHKAFDRLLPKITCDKTLFPD